MEERKQYRIKKIGMNTTNPLAESSQFGNSQEYFQGYALHEPTVGKIFILLSEIGRVVINTSPIVKIKEGELLTTYSKYSIEEV